MFTCVAFIFASMLEVAFVAYQVRVFLRIHFSIFQDKKLVLKTGRSNPTLNAIFHFVKAFDPGNEDHEQDELAKRKQAAYLHQKGLLLDFGAKLDRFSFYAFPTVCSTLVKL